MCCSEQFSDVTKQYLCCFYEILDNMIEEMTSAKLTNSISHNFIVQMIPHHQAAIKMSQSILQYTTLLPLQNIAKNIISEQTKGIESMKEILGVCGEQFDSKQDICLYQNEFEQITRTMFSQMRNACSTNQINANFMREMIPHHQGAIRMSKNALHFSVCPQLIPILQTIIVSQEKGVREMKALLHCI